MSYFAKYDLTYRLLLGPNSGFRPGQMGCLHVIVGHFSVFEVPAIASLPTGYGKTAILMALPFMLQAKRVLVVEPSDALRKQSASHIRELSTLRRLKVLDEETPNPRVLALKGHPNSEATWDELRDFDVVVSTPNSSSPVDEPKPPADLFDVIFFDEAHYAPADTWDAYLRAFPKAKFVFLTATPFRRDRKVIPGRLAYWYPVLRASQEGAFGKVRFRSASAANEMDDAEVDRAIAVAAVEQLEADRERGFDHRIFARAASIPSARKLVEVYRKAGGTVEAVNSHLTKRAQDRVEQMLIKGELDGVVCVDMFGEGYDFPKLKIAALHAPHRSLVPTLQFIGRFARTNDEATGDATLIAPVGRLRQATTRLFKEGVDIAELIDEAAKEQLSEAEADREVLNVLKPIRQADSDYESVTPLLLELFAHAQIFECDQTPDFDQLSDSVGRRLRIAKDWRSDDGLLALLLTVDTSPPDWASSDVIANVRHDAFLLAYNKASKLCFIGSTRRRARIYLDLMDTVCKEHHRPIAYERTRRALAGLKNLRFYNVGLRNTALNSQAETYRTLTGPRAEKVVNAGDGRSYVQGHFFGSGEDGDGRETIGASSSSRVWSNRRLTVAEYLDWLTVLNGRLNSKAGIAPSQLDIIQYAKHLKKLAERVIAASWHKVAYREAPRVRYRGRGSDDWKYNQLTDWELSGFHVGSDQTTLEFSATCEEFSIDLNFSLRGGAMFSNAPSSKEVDVISGYDDWEPIAVWLSLHPPIFHAADKSSFQGVNLLKGLSSTVVELLESDAEELDWEGCDITQEFRKDSTPADSLTVHEYLERHLLSKSDTMMLVYDHRTGEAADYIALVAGEESSITVQLYHCKAAGGTSPDGTRVDDVYEVAGQLVKSVSFFEPSVLLPHLERRIDANRHKVPTKFLKGDYEGFKRALEDTSPEKLSFEVFAVQPGISRSRVNAHLGDLMAYGIDYARRGGAVSAKWIVSH